MTLFHITGSDSEAYETVLAAADAQPAIQLPIDDDWQEVLKSSRRIERSMQDLSVFDEQIERYWHLAKVVNVFLRWQIETTKLLACVRDPETGQILNSVLKDGCRRNGMSISHREFGRILLTLIFTMLLDLLMPSFEVDSDQFFF